MDLITTFTGQYSNSTAIKGYSIRTSQSAMNGGDDENPAPFDLLLTSISACSAVYVDYFCQKRGIPTENIRVILKTVVDPEKKKIGKIIINVEIPADFPEKYIKPMMKSVDMCAVKKLILDPPEFELAAVTTPL
ncbi:MAG: OsmC family protein [Candidatus Krumholzibacteriota bacterium]|nr:OsmC family protein [Candidatus Krumholzibacteriota bacterium]